MTRAPPPYPPYLCARRRWRTDSAAETSMTKPSIPLTPAVTKNGRTSASELRSSTIGGDATAMLFLR